MRPIGLPEGSRDLLRQASREKRQFVRQFEELYEYWGFEQVETPTIEYQAAFEEGLTDDADLSVKLISADQEVLALRSDMTIPVARMVASKYNDFDDPLRFRYTGNVYRTKEKFDGLLNELTSTGVELFGAGGLEENLEVLTLAIEALDSLEVDHYVLELGDVRFFNGVCDYLGLDQKLTSCLADLVDMKYLTKLNKKVDGLDLKEEEADFFRELPFLTSSKDIPALLEKARKYAFNDELNKVLDEMAELISAIKEIRPEANIRIDFSKIPSLDYYTSLIFNGYVEGIGESVMSGGRYDNLVGLFGPRQRKAVGFGIKADFLLNLDTEVKEDPLVTIQYPTGSFKEALALANEEREKGQRVVLELADVSQVQVEGRG